MAREIFARETQSRNYGGDMAALSQPSRPGKQVGGSARGQLRRQRFACLSEPRQRPKSLCFPVQKRLVRQLAWV